MKNTLEKNKTQKANVKNVSSVTNFILHVLLITGIMLLLCGCEEVRRKQAKQEKQAPAASPAVDVRGLHQEATRIILEALADDSDPLARINAIEVIAATGQVRLMPKVERLLHDESVLVRFAAALAVGDLQYSIAKKSVYQLLKDRNPNVRVAASYAMVKLGRPEYFRVLPKAITSRDQTVRANAALLLGKSGDKRALNVLHWALKQKNSDDKVLFQVAVAIATLGDEQIFPKLWAMLISAYADDRVLGIEAMRMLGTTKAKNSLVTMLDDAVLEVRLAAAEQLGALNDTIGEPVVLDVFQRNLTAGMEKQDIQRANMKAALAIGQIGTNSLTKYLPQLLKDESKFVRIAAAKAAFQCTTKK